MNTDPEDKTVVGGLRSVAGEQRGAMIGRYRLMEVIGEGGMGTVWMAEQQEPLVRRVALKIIKLGMDTGEVVTRFEQERQALALMDHPAIAKVLDAGATESGRPYFVMELVDGVPLTTYCDRHRLDVRGRLKLFIEICQAVQHAHQKGIIHRDLKPSNILVSEGDDGQPQPRVIDFGIAKATGPALAGQRTLTHIAQIIGTPAYMSPEQARLSPVDIDTRSDIYSLGVVLYELLTGRPPFDSAKLIGAGMEEMQRIIREETPPRPSNRLAALAGQELTSIAEQRHATVGRITTAVRGDLDWIVMKALEKDRRRRYETVGAMAADLQRHLEHQPVLARPPGAGYLLSRFIRRHKVGFAAGAAVTAALIAGITAATWGFLKAATERDKAERARGTAEGLINSMLYDLRDKLAPIGKVELLDDVSRQAEKYFEAMPEEQVTPQVLREKSSMLTNRGTVLAAQGKSDQAKAAFNAAREIMERLTKLDPNNTNWRQHLAVCHARLADVALPAGDLPGARVAAATSLAISERLANADPANAVFSSDLALSYNQTGRMEEAGGNLPLAREAYLKALAIRERLAQRDPGNRVWQRNLAASYQALAGLAKNSTALESAIGYYDKALGILKSLAEAEPENAPAQIDLATGHQLAGEAAAEAGHLEAAREALEKDLAISKRLADKDPDNAEWQGGLATSFEHRGSFAKSAGDIVTARSAMEKALAIRQRLVAADPANFKWQSALANCLILATQIAVRENEPVKAAEYNGKALKIMEQFAARDPANLDWQLSLSVCWIVKGDIERGRGDFPPARIAYAEAVAIRERMLQRDAANAGWQSYLAEAHDRMGEVAFAENNLPAAKEGYSKALAIYEDLAKRDEKNAQAQRDLMLSYGALGKLAKKEGNLDAQRQVYTKILPIAERLAQSDPGNADRQQDWVVTCVRMYEVEKESGNTEQSDVHRKKAVEILKEMKTKGIKLDTAFELFLLKETLLH